MMQEDSNGDFEFVDKKMTSLLVSDGSAATSSVLTSVAPPSALPSFLTAPLPATPGPPHPGAPPPTTGTPHNLPPTTGTPPISSPGCGTTPFPPPGASPLPPPGASPLPPPGASPLPPPGPSHGPAVPIPMGGVGAPPMYGTVPPPGQPPPPFPPSTASVAPTSSSPSAPQVRGRSPPPPEASFVPRPPPPAPVTHQPHPPTSSGGGADVTASVDLGSPGTEPRPPHGWLGWIRGTVSNVGHRVAERAKTSMDTMITTLDPQMKEFIHSGGDVDLIVASEKEVKVGAVREAFQLMFGKATVRGVAAQAEGVAAQPVGFDAALHSAEERINFLRSSGHIHPHQPIVAVENFIVELTPECWYDIGLLLLDDPGEDIILQTYTQVTPIPPKFVSQARDSTPEDYACKASGLATTIGQVASQELQVHHTLWQETLTGVPRRDLVVLAARALAGLYKNRLSRPR